MGHKRLKPLQQRGIPLELRRKPLPQLGRRERLRAKALQTVDDVGVPLLARLLPYEEQEVPGVGPAVFGGSDCVGSATAGSGPGRWCVGGGLWGGG